MNVLVLGGTGSVGRGVVAALLRHGHEVSGLARSRKSADRLAAAGAAPVRGGLENPDQWQAAIAAADGIVHAAATWGDDGPVRERKFVETLLRIMAKYDPPKALVYTGGTWKYGPTGDDIADEDSPPSAFEAFAETVGIERRVLSAPGLRGMAIHPGMVYEDDGGGVFDFMYRDASESGRVRVVAGEQVRWPLVHQQDLGELYALMLESGKPGDVFNGVAIEGVPVGRIARAIARTAGIPETPVVMSITDASTAIGPWAEGYAIDQQVSGRKAMRGLGWKPAHTDVLADIARD